MDLKNGRLDHVIIALENGANIHALGDSALRYAGGRGHLDVVRYLVEHGANISARNNEALLYAGGRGYLDVVRYLIEHGDNIDEWEYNMLLKLAKINSHLEVVKYLESL